MKSILFKIFMVFILSLALFSCKKDEAVLTSTDSYMKVAEGISANSSYNVQMYASDSLFVGYNVVYFKVFNVSNGKSVSEANITFHPLMDMGTYKHACPVENPASTVNSQGYFQGAILFSMPGTNSWTLDVAVTIGSITDTVHFAFAKVIAMTPARKIVVIDSLETSPGTWKITKHPISLLYPPKWVVGNNTFEITIHTMASMMSFPPATDLTVEITPEMPSMGHGSPNNVNPVHTQNGHYVGTANFTMTGDWRIHLTIKEGTRLITDKAYFDILF